MKKISKKKLSIISAIIVAILIVGGVSAYLTDTDNKTNVFTVGSVKISLNEPNWNQSNGQYVVPGQTVQKDPTIENIGKNSAYVYIKVEQPMTDLTSGGEGPLFSYTTNSGWTLLDNYVTVGCPTMTSIYYYNTALAKNTSTTKLFNNVTVNDFTQESATGNKDMVVTGYAIQSSNLPSGTTIQSAYNTYFSDENINTCNSETTIYRWKANHWTANQNISSFTSGTDYVTNRLQVPNIHPCAELYFLKYTVESNVTTKQYVCFEISDAIAQANSGIKPGEYCLKGYDESAFETNINILNMALSNNYCMKDSSTHYSCHIPSIDLIFSIGTNDTTYTIPNQISVGNGSTAYQSKSGYCNIYIDGRSTCDEN